MLDCLKANFCYIISAIMYIAAIAVFLTPFLRPGSKRVRDNGSVYRIFAILLLFCSMLQTLVKAEGAYEMVWNKVYQAIIQFVLNTDFYSIISAIPSRPGKVLAGLNMLTAPIVTVTTVLFAFESFRNNFLLWIYKYLRSHDSIYIFSELNEKSLSIAKSIVNDGDNRNIKFVFTDVFDQNNECSYELIGELKDLGIAYTKKDIVSLGFNSRLLREKRSYKLFFVGENEAENLRQLCCIIDNYKRSGRKDTAELYLLSRSSTSELTIKEKLADCHGIIVKRIDYKRSMVYDYLYNHGNDIINACKNGHGIVILGLGEYGLEMLKALLWFCRFNNEEVNISVYDSDPNVEERFKSACPGFYDELTVKMLGGVSMPSFNKGIDGTVDFERLMHLEEICNANPDAGFIFVCAGDDDKNIRISQKMREINVQKKYFCTGEITQDKPLIVSIVHDDRVYDSLTENGDTGNEFTITPIGNFATIYSKSVLQINSELEKMALATHLGGCEEENSYEIFNDEYYYRSTVSQVIYLHNRFAEEIKYLENVFRSDEQGVATLLFHKGFSDDEMQCLKDIYYKHGYEKIQKNEKNRWNYYMLSEGYRYLPPEFAEQQAIFKRKYHYHKLLRFYNDEEHFREWEYTYRALWGMKRYQDILNRVVPDR